MFKAQVVIEEESMMSICLQRKTYWLNYLVELTLIEQLHKGTETAVIHTRCRSRRFFDCRCWRHWRHTGGTGSIVRN